MIAILARSSDHHPARLSRQCLFASAARQSALYRCRATSCWRSPPTRPPPRRCRLLARSLFSAVAALALASAAQFDLKADWKLTGRAPAAALKTFSVAMPMRDFPGLEKTLLEISDPYSKRYGQWLTLEEADVFAATPDETAEEVLAWAESTGASCVRLAESLKCKGSVAALEELLSTELSTYVHTQSGRSIIRTSAPASMPLSLEGKALFLTGLTRFPIPRLGNSRPAAVLQAINGGAADYTVVPQTLVALYNVTSSDGAAASTQAPVEFQGYPSYVQTDLDTFTKDVNVPDFTIPKSQIIGPFNANAQAESTLDEQCA